MMFLPGQRDVARLLAELAGRGMACLLASHDPDMLAALTRNVVRLQDDRRRNSARMD